MPLFLFLIVFSFITTLNALVIDSLDVESFVSNSSVFVPLDEGNYLYKGLNLRFIENGGFKYKNISLNYSFLEDINPSVKRFSIFKLYTEASLGGFYFSFGKKSKSIGPLENSLILSKNAPPFLMLDVAYKKITESGKIFNFNLVHGWLDDERVDNSDPKILILRFDYSPSNMLGIGFTRHSMYGGKNAKGLRLWDYPRFILGTDENNSYSKYDSDGYLGYDVVLNLEEKFRSFDRFKLYFQQIATDITAPWQKEDKGKWSFPFIVKLQLNSYQAGIEIERFKKTYKLEFTSVNDLYYIHHLYPVEGYTYRGFCLGFPYGRYLYDINLSYQNKSNPYDLSLKFGFMKQPNKDKYRHTGSYVFKYKMKKIYAEAKFLRKISSKLEISPYIRFEYDINHDYNPNPVQFDIMPENKLGFFCGLNFYLKIGV